MALIQVQPPRACELCNVQAECRPYGPNGEWVCFPCGMKDEEAAKRQFNTMYFRKKEYVMGNANFTSYDDAAQELAGMIEADILYIRSLPQGPDMPAGYGDGMNLFEEVELRLLSAQGILEYRGYTASPQLEETSEGS